MIRCVSVLMLAALVALCAAPRQAAAAQVIEFPNGGSAEMDADGTITGMCQLVDGRIGSTYAATAILPDGARLPAGCYESLTGVPNHNYYLGPCDGTYRFKATRRGSGYFIYVYSQNAAAPAPGASVSKPPAGYTYQHAYAKDWNPQILVDVTFEKTSTDASFVASSGEYSVAGAAYDIFEAGTDLKAASIVTGEDGHASCKLEFGKSYYAVETAAPAGYVASGTRVEFTASGGVVTLADEPVRVDVVLRKTDSATGGAAQPGASLEGAVFKLVDARGVAQEATTDVDGWARFSSIPLGAFSIVETRAPDGYKLDPTVHEYHVGADAAQVNGVVSLELASDFPEDVVAFDVELAKFKEDPNASESGVRWPAEGVQFEIISNTTGAVVTTLTTDAYGFARTPDGAWYGSGTRPEGVCGSLPFDSKGYLVREVASTVPEGYERMDDVTIGAEEQVDGIRLKYIIENKTPATRLQIVKTDALSGQTVPLAGFTFRLLDAAGNPVEQSAWYPNHVKLNEFTTDESGGVTLPEQLVPGSYSIEEVSAQAPYLLGDAPMKVELGGAGGSVAVVRFANEQATGCARIVKKDSETGEALPGAAFNVVAQNLVQSPDGTVQAVAGEVVAQVETNAHGVAKVDGLPLGTGTARYAFVETRPPQGYVLDETPHVFELSYKNAETSVVETQVEAANTPTEVRVFKLDEQTGESLEGVLFSVRKTSIDPRSGGTGSGQEGTGQADAGLVEETDADGVASWKRLTPGDYVLVETEALLGYLPDTTERAFSITEEGAVVGCDADGCFTINNDHTKVEISKRDSEHEEELAGAHLVVLDDEGDVVEQWVSTDEPYRIDCLEPGSYVLREERTPATHDTAEDVPFEVLATDDIQRVVMYDTPIEVSGQVDKRQEIASPTAADTVANGDGNNRVEARESDKGVFDYALDWRNTSNTWTDEFTVTDTLLCCIEGLAVLDGITTPVAEGDFDGKLNVWYLTNASDGSESGDEAVSATRSDGHSNPWLQDEAVIQKLGTDGRVLPFEGWHLWAEGISATEAVELSVDGLGLADGEYVTGIRFEYGCVEQGFTTREGEWDRDGLKDPHDDVEKIAAGADRTEDSDDAAVLAPAILHMRATDAYRADTVMINAVQVDLYRNGGGESLEDHDSDAVEQTAGDAAKPIPVTPHADMPQTGDVNRVLVSFIATAGVTAVAAGLVGRRRRARASR